MDKLEKKIIKKGFEDFLKGVVGVIVIGIVTLSLIILGVLFFFPSILLWFVTKKSFKNLWKWWFYLFFRYTPLVDDYISYYGKPDEDPKST